MTYDEIKTLVFERLDDQEQHKVEMYLDGKETMLEKTAILEAILGAFNYIDSAIKQGLLVRNLQT
ncbi:TPA: hypothetical protein TVQ98_000461 [Streptococcus equi subsp. zooepidemicus]|uniref:hypothetical protein n=1 Tax=Streptococcus equi TaxID=1336 RepID=UPI0010C3CBA0|nr:hypothetical protein [Streptococcus equi]MCD3394729.1 hypothetical protein [Streptococcus equi subsp. zooepidemicus]MCD3450279.1 hypothetical protein [Streptococcus equi subsp. zooepidemicus]WOK57919.1 hypothetical protein RIM63_03875 [Streptococcus equi subsp. zooepidemicus]VTP88244.1 Uncharacterised protein [Streptococcus equi subsp. zooepidemicus]HEK9995236.1 hypothetical protein [Streptococcus equi subsp. zooepidemicus]